MQDRHATWEEILKVLESSSAGDPTVTTHISDCPRCGSLAEEARLVLGLLADARLPVPPTALIERTLALIRAGAAQATGAGLPDLIERLRGTLRETWGTLTADSLRPTRSVRGTATAGRTLRYETPEYVVTLSLRPAAGASGHDIVGLLVPRTARAVPPDAHAAAAREGEMLEARIHSTGEFRLIAVPAGCGEVGIIAGDDWIRLRLPLA